MAGQDGAAGGGRKAEVGGRRSEIGGPAVADPPQKRRVKASAVAKGYGGTRWRGRQRAEDGGQRTEGGGQRAEVGIQQGKHGFPQKRLRPELHRGIWGSVK